MSHVSIIPYTHTVQWVGSLLIIACEQLEVVFFIKTSSQVLQC